MTTTVIIQIGKAELTVRGEYTPAEPEVRYYKDGSGYPGHASEFEAESIIYNRIEVIELIAELDKVIDINDLCIKELEGDE